VSPRLPPPDPGEPAGTPPEGMRMAAPAAVFVNGRPSRELDRLTDAILDARPGLLFVFLRR
jgi:hypothetical protein